MKELYILSACPGSGKSTWCNNLKKRNANRNIVILSSDETRFELTGQYQDFSKQDEVWKLYESRIRAINEKDEDVILVLDALNDLNILRQKYAKMCDKFDKKTLVFIKKPLEEILLNNISRRKEKQLPEPVLISLYNKLEDPDTETLRLFDDYSFIDYYFAKEE